MRTCGAGAAALHHIVRAVEEIGGVSRIKLKRLKTRKWREQCRGPLPSVSDQIGNAKCALSLSKRSDWCWIPALEVEVSKSWVGLFIPPRIGTLHSLWRPISGPMPLRFSGQRLPCPPRIRAGFRVTYINRPVKRQRNILKHRSVLPFAFNAIPKDWMRNIAFGLPLPICIAPKRRIFVAAGIYEL